LAALELTANAIRTDRLDAMQVGALCVQADTGCVERAHTGMRPGCSLTPHAGRVRARADDAMVVCAGAGYADAAGTYT